MYTTAANSSFRVADLGMSSPADECRSRGQSLGAATGIQRYLCVSSSAVEFACFENRQKVQTIKHTCSSNRSTYHNEKQSRIRGDNQKNMGKSGKSMLF